MFHFLRSNHGTDVGLGTGEASRRRAMPTLGGVFAAVALILAVLTPASRAQSAERHGTVERVKVHGRSLEGNLSGDSPDRYVSIYLPPSYKTSKARHYPVVYLLHGYNGTDALWYSDPKHYIVVPNVADNAINSGTAHEMIIVTPDAHTLFAGSFYSNSVTTGNWEDFIARDLVGYIDSHYRTLHYAASRGLTGHSMGGYGALRIAMKHPEIFSSLYLMSPGPLGDWLPGTPEEIAAMEAVKTVEDFRALNGSLRGRFAAAAAWAPDPTKPPLYLDLPVRDGQLVPQIMNKFVANQPLAMIDQYIANLKRLHAIGFDAGAQDPVIAANLKLLDEILKNYDIAHEFQIYEGTHTSRIAERFETKALPFFSEKLQFTVPKTQ
jgi:S-formylglutathione hydrolase